MRLPMRKAFKPAPESIRFETGVLRHRAKAISPAYEGPYQRKCNRQGADILAIVQHSDISPYVETCLKRQSSECI